MRDTLLICAPAPVVEIDGGVQLDLKFVEGMRMYARDWTGPVRSVLWRGAKDIPFGGDFQLEELGFELVVLDDFGPLPSAALNGVAVAMISADQMGLEQAMEAARAQRVPVVVGIEYTLETRLKINELEREIGALRKLRRAWWLKAQEKRVRQALRAAEGVQFNGYPAEIAYRELTNKPLMYLDSRMTRAMMATDAEMTARAQRLRRGAPLRLIHSGRLETMKGAQDLLPVMRGLVAHGIDATLDIYGVGSLSTEIEAGLGEFDGRVRLHGPVDFATQLVPISRTDADVFLSCHRQSDPSCTYIEAMGCGLALVGYDNAMWSALSTKSGTGQIAPLGDAEALARAIASWNANRDDVITSMYAGLAFARAHDFSTEFSRRIEHLKACASHV